MAINKKAILIAAADAALRRDLKRDLGRQGFGVSQARDQQQLLWRLGVNGIDLTIIGSGPFGGWDGPELACEIRKRDRRLPIIFISAHSNEEQAIAALRAGVKDYFTSPYTLEMLTASIHRVLAASQARVATEPIERASASHEPNHGDGNPLGKL